MEMDNTENKCVIVADEALPAGILANTSAILGMTLGKCLPDCVGENVADGSGLMHKGITNIPIPMLKGSKLFIKNLRETLFTLEFVGLIVVDFSNVAQGCASYCNYTERAKTLKEADFNYLGIAIYGSKKKVNKLTGSLPLLR